MKYLIISDLHIGDGTGTDDFGDNDFQLLSFLSEGLWEKRFDKVILNGDIYELWQCGMRRIREAHRSICRYLESEVRLERVKGNHDYILGGKIKKIIKTKSGKKILITHGFQADGWMNSPIARFLSWCLGKVEKLFPKIDNVFCKPEAIEEKVRSYAFKKLKEYDVVILGHTHKQKIKKIRPIIGNLLRDEIVEKELIYANSGCCLDGRIEGILLDTETDELEIVKV